MTLGVHNSINSYFTVGESYRTGESAFSPHFRACLPVRKNERGTRHAILLYVLYTIPTSLIRFLPVLRRGRTYIYTRGFDCSTGLFDSVQKAPGWT